MTRILGIDPGSQRTGVGIIDVDASGRVSHVHHQPLVLLGADDFPQRMKLLVLGLAELCHEYQPQEVAIEKVFMARNPDSALKLGQARGAAISAVVLRDLPVHEYAASEIKLAVVGRGGAEKQQVQHMVGLMLNLKTKLQADAADALAVAITHAHVRATANRLGLTARHRPWPGRRCSVSWWGRAILAWWVRTVGSHALDRAMPGGSRSMPCVDGLSA